MGEFTTLLEDEGVQATFESLEIDCSLAWKLFASLDHDGSLHIERDEFISGCMRLRGAAKRSDAELVLATQRKTNKILRYVLDRMYKDDPANNPMHAASSSADTVPSHSRQITFSPKRQPIENP